VEKARQAVKPIAVRRNLNDDTFMIYNALIWLGNCLPMLFYNRFSDKIILFELLFSRKVN
jgi:hypothetical protein